jgi:hypothetical protein
MSLGPRMREDEDRFEATLSKLAKSFSIPKISIPKYSLPSAARQIVSVAAWCVDL